MTTFPIRFVTQFANFKLPEVAKERHICQHNKLSLENARRQTEENRKGDETPKNHIFENRGNYTLYKTLNGQFAVSDQKVATVFCTYSNGKWTSEYVGLKYAVFQVFDDYIVHFSGGVYDQVDIRPDFKDFYGANNLTDQSEESGDPMLE